MGFGYRGSLGETGIAPAGAKGEKVGPGVLAAEMVLSPGVEDGSADVVGERTVKG